MSLPARAAERALRSATSGGGSGGGTIVRLRRFSLYKCLGPPIKVAVGQQLQIERMCEGVVFVDEQVAARFLADGSIKIYPSMRDMLDAIEPPEHGAELFWDDDPGTTVV